MRTNKIKDEIQDISGNIIWDFGKNSGYNNFYMTYRQFITIKIPDRNESIDFEVPFGRSILEVFPVLLRWLNLSPISDKNNLPYVLWSEKGELIDMSRNFVQAEIENFKTLILDSQPPLSSSHSS